MTQQILSYFQIGVAILLGTSILLQQKGQGLSGAFGGEGGFYRTKRGLEKTLLVGTIVLAVLFMGISLSRIVLSPTPSPATSLPEQPSDIPAFDLGTELEGSNNIPITIPEIEVQTEPVSDGENQ